MGESPDNEWYFGRVSIRAVIGELIEQPATAIVYAANERGMMEAATPGSIRQAAGAEIEREAMTQAPHAPGSVFVTGSGRLATRGIETIFHLVLAGMLGEPPRRDLLARTLAQALTLAEQQRIRVIAIPLLGASIDSSEEDRLEVATLIVDTIVSHLRRTPSRFDAMLVVSRFADDLPLITAALEQARRRSWVE